MADPVLVQFPGVSVKVNVSTLPALETRTVVVLPTLPGVIGRHLGRRDTLAVIGDATRVEARTLGSQFPSGGG